MITETDNVFKTVCGENFIPSKEQLEIFNFVKYGIGNATIESRAGSGKSKTIELACHFIPSDKKALIIAYNKHIADNLKEKLKGLKNITVLTYHSLGFKLLNSKIHDVELNEDKYNNYIFSNISELSENFLYLNKADKARYLKNVRKLLDYSRYNLMQSKREIEKMAIKYVVKTFSDECDTVKKIMKWGENNSKQVDYQDMIWLPYELGIKTVYGFQFDYIFIDEAQDSSLAQQNLIDICTKRNTRFFSFGDGFQTINSWAGADENAFANFNKRSNVKQFVLRTSYRCSRKVIEKAKELVPDLNVYENASEGNVAYNVSLDNIKNGDLVLCRLTSPLVKLYLKFLNEGKKVAIKGVEIGNEIIDNIKCIDINDISDLKKILKINLIKKWEEIAEMYQTDLKSVAGNPDITLMYDDILTLDIISEGVTTKEELMEKINTLFTKVKDNNIEDKTKIHLSTVHRAKGLENDNVFILCPSLMPNKMAVRDWEKKSEHNLIYVAWTRAKKTLNFVSEKEFPPEKSYSGNNNDFYNELLNIKKEIDFEN